ncbi:hypothetical protein ACRAWF_33290 [Streptomyces sp. L7]
MPPSPPAAHLVLFRPTGNRPTGGRRQSSRAHVARFGADRPRRRSLPRPRAPLSVKPRQQRAPADPVRARPTPHAPQARQGLPAGGSGRLPAGDWVDTLLLEKHGPSLVGVAAPGGSRDVRQLGGQHRCSETAQVGAAPRSRTWRAVAEHIPCWPPPVL